MTPHKVCRKSCRVPRSASWGSANCFGDRHGALVVMWSAKSWRCEAVEVREKRGNADAALQASSAGRYEVGRYGEGSG